MPILEGNAMVKQVEVVEVVLQHFNIPLFGPNDHIGIDRILNEEGKLIRGGQEEDSENSEEEEEEEGNEPEESVSKMKVERIRRETRRKKRQEERKKCNHQWTRLK
ncbi:hypothetical protein M9H77_12618 [Catharanthus roseus]|uniref:Uncharacterized protein n=1 Tax=Catharanthus roseus TaxID=4058 RepID=A0ACC0BHY5_CATRO|nr:hypothetical protein M9H77_12618 [Catharanthus roseus]